MARRLGGAAGLSGWYGEAAVPSDGRKQNRWARIGGGVAKNRQISASSGEWWRIRQLLLLEMEEEGGGRGELLVGCSGPSTTHARSHTYDPNSRVAI